MSLPSIDFRHIRPLNGSHQDGFEELCCQLASLEPMYREFEFHRKGRGGDAGIECFVRLPSGDEVGWQAKYLFKWNDSLRSQLDRSIATALEKHPKLKKYIVCIPFDLPDSRSGKHKTALQKWDAWREKWQNNAAQKGHELTISLWGKSELCGRLAQDDPAHAGRTLYWFDVEVMTSAWFNERFATAKASLGSRYTPETNVELPIRQDFIAFARHPWIQKEIDRCFIEVIEKGQFAADTVRAMSDDVSGARADTIDTALKTLLSIMPREQVALDKDYPTNAWHAAASSLRAVAWEAFEWCFDLSLPTSPGEGSDAEQRVRHDIRRLIDALDGMIETLSSNRWRMANAKAVLLKGPAGIGKSHLLADFMSHHLQRGGPAILLLGGMFTDRDIWSQIREQLDRPPAEQFRQFLGALDAAAETAGTKAVLCIDALNERHGLQVWPERLSDLLQTVAQFKRVGVALSCRSTYTHYVVPDHLITDALLTVDHEGFGGDAEEATNIYLDMRGIVRPGTPNMLPEFENPLFLKTCCDSLERRGENTFPKGLQGVTFIFNFFNDTVTEAVEKRMELDPHHNIVKRAISEFAALLIRENSVSVETHIAVNAFEQIYRSGAHHQRSLLSQLEHEGLLTIEVQHQEDGSPRESVRFTFERFGDHAVASQLLRGHLNKEDIEGSFLLEQPLAGC